MSFRISATLIALASTFSSLPAPAVAASTADGVVDRPAIAANDNRRPAGVLRNETLRLTLRAQVGLWRPEGPTGVALPVEAFGDELGPLQVPAPLVRVPEGTLIAARIRNDLEATLTVHGLCTRDGSACEPIEVPAGGSRDVRFHAGRAGTYHYWATTTDVPFTFRGSSDSQLSGAFVVDPKDATSDPDRILVITEWTSLTRDQLSTVLSATDPGAAFLALDPRRTFVINGLSWPATERFAYRIGDRVRWRVVNLSTQLHPMHLHGFYFDVEASGDGLRDSAIDVPARQHVVTHLMKPGATMTMTWRAEREGNWLFHCHIVEHVSPKRRLTEAPAHAAHHHDAAAGMAGMILGVTITGGRAPVPSPEPAAAKRFTLAMREQSGRYGADPAYAFVLAGGGAESDAELLSVPGPTLALKKGEPVEITLVNELPEATAIHWHGIELDSYYDGVHGWSGAGTRVTPIIEPGTSFTVRFTPPRAGTFIYHTHLHDERQLTSGLYGALVVLDDGERFDPDRDHVMVIGRGGADANAPVVLNGAREPQFVWKAGVRHRLRLINITPGDIVVATLGGETRAAWTPLAKDGARVPAIAAGPRPATQTIAVGETYDFEYDAPPGRSGLWLEVRSTGGRWHVQGRVVIK